MRVIFSIGDAALQKLRLSDELLESLPTHFAYVEWYSKLQRKDPNTGLYRISSAPRPLGPRDVEVVGVNSLLRSCHLFPVFGLMVSRDWDANNVLDECRDFLLNAYKDRSSFHILT